MSHDPKQVEAIFHTALAKSDADERAAYLSEACGDDADLRRQLERLLDAHFELGEFLGAAGSPDPGTVDHARPVGLVGTVLAGRYKLLEAIGEGGMGSVFMAQQTEPIKRLVAVKVIKPGMDSAQVLARFEAERQALALMDHPNIAKVLDAGTTGEPGASRRPFFVMELVKGMPITKYCDDRHLTPRERLGPLYPRLPGDPARPPEGHHPPRHQAEQRAGGAVRRQAGAQGDRLRRGQGGRASN